MSKLVAKVIKRAMITCENSGHNVTHEFPEVRKIVEAGSGENSGFVHFLVQH